MSGRLERDLPIVIPKSLLQETSHIHNLLVGWYVLAHPTPSPKHMFPNFVKLFTAYKKSPTGYIVVLTDLLYNF